MNPSTSRTAKKLLLALLAVLLLALIAASFFHHRQPSSRTTDEQRLARTLGILHASTPAHHQVLRVLFYGQSITKSGWHLLVLDHWRQTYPNTDFVVQNLALGGFPSDALLRTAERDLASFNPDLIVFHDYGNHHAYESILRILRSRTAADLLVQTDHGEVLPDLPCDEGLHLTLHAPPGCRGLLYYRQRLWSDEMSYHKIPAFADTYQFAMEPVRGWWRDYLLRTHTDPKSLLQDEIHPNPQGKQLMAALFNQYFDNLVAHYNGETAHDVAELKPDPQQAAAGTLHLAFTGTRLELITSSPLSIWPNIDIDEQSPKDLDGCYLVSRATPLATVPDWPSIRRITLLHDHTPEQWTATLTNLSPDQKTFDFTLTASTSGSQGSGHATHDFTATSGLLRLEAQDWMIQHAFEYTHKPTIAPFEVHWSVDYLCGGTKPDITDRGDGTTEYRYLLAAGLPNTLHEGTLILRPTDAQKIDHLLASHPRLAN